MRSARRLARSLTVGLALAWTASAQDTADPDRAQDERLEKLEQRNEELEERLALLESDDGELYDDAYVEEDYGLGMEVSYGEVGGTFQIFGDVGFRYDNPEPSAKGHTSFFLGSLDFVINGRFGDHWRFLSETVIEGKTDDVVGFSQERLWGAWVPSDAFYAKLGTEHNPISRWNQLFHHGRWLETTIRRPVLAYFEGGNGILPLHRTGLMIGGSQMVDAGRFEYFGFLSNGRGELPSDKQRTDDSNDEKAIDVGLAFEPFAKSDWRFGLAATWDTIPVNPASMNPLRMSSMAEWIYTAQIEWRRGAFFTLGELAFIDHEARANSQTYGSNTGYVQVEYHVEDWTPYGRADYRNMDELDPFYGDLGRNTDLYSGTLGVRWDVAPNVALKLEGSLGSYDVIVSPGVTMDRSTALAGLQLSWWL